MKLNFSYDDRDLSKREKAIALCGVGIGFGLGVIFMIVIGTLLGM